MKRSWFLALFLLASVWSSSARHRGTAQVKAPKAPAVQWVWFNEGDPLSSAPAESRYFRQSFTIDPKVIEGQLEITADNTFTVWLNGTKVGQGDSWQNIYRFNVGKHLKPGKNVIAVEAGNQGGPAALMVRLRYGPAGGPKQTLVTDGKWKGARTAGKGWQAAGFDEKGWTPVKVLGPYGKVGPWTGGGRVAGPPRITVPEGFVVEEAVKRPDDRGPFSLVNMTFDARGRLLLSQEGGPTLLCTEPDKGGVYQKVVPYCTQVTNSQGMCWVGDALLLVGNGPQGTGLYRCQDTKGTDQIDRVTLLHKFQGGMGEHGPHAIIHGPDNWLYLVIGNHAWAQPQELADNSPLTRWPKGTKGPAQGQPGTTEDVLLPRQNDARGHAANILAPGGTIWRLDHEGKNLSLISAGFRNEFDAAFSPLGELFAYDSDMEWDENLPWYRPVRVVHCIPGGEFGWRTGSSKLPPYYLDTLPALIDIGRGSPVGVEFCNHRAFPDKYRTLFVCDWSVGIIYAIHMTRNGATYRAEAEKFCTGSPMNVTDAAVGPDGAFYFTRGGRGSQGGVHRIRAVAARTGPAKADRENPALLALAKADQTAERLVDADQPLSAWGRAHITDLMTRSGADRKEVVAALGKITEKGSVLRRKDGETRALAVFPLLGAVPSPELLSRLTMHRKPEVRAQSLWLLGRQGDKRSLNTLVKALRDDDALVRRRACEALVRARLHPPVAALGPVLADSDHFVRTAARLVLQRIDPKEWADRLWRSEDRALVREGIVALCKIGKAEPYAESIFAKLHETSPGDEVQDLLDHLRTIELALVHTSKRPGTVRGIALECLEMFPHKDDRVNRELAILLTYFRREKVLDEPVHAKLLKALLDAEGDRPQQIHYFYCLRLLHDGWKPEEKDKLLAWYESTRSWKGGASFTPYLENILKDLLPAFTREDLARVLERVDRQPLSVAVLLRNATRDQLPRPDVLLSAYKRLGGAGPVKELKPAIVSALGREGSAPAQEALRKLADTNPGIRDQVALALAGSPTAENWKYLLRGLESSNKGTVFEMIQALKQSPVKAKVDEPAPFRALLLASSRLDPGNRWRAVELLRHWTKNQQFGANRGDWKTELGSWSRWFTQSFPKEPALPNVTADQVVESKYKFKDLLSFLEKEGRQGDPSKGRLAFEKAQCIKCHKYGKEGEGIGPDLTTLSKRFKRADMLEAIYYPSKVISDQYRSTTIVTRKGLQVQGLAAPQGDTITVLQSDGSKVMVKEKDIEQRYASLTSVMPEKLLDLLTKQEIADLFAFLESEPAK
jgi:putative heme-binding domain-containing protein